jgi:hypothetical protein
MNKNRISILKNASNKSAFPASAVYSTGVTQDLILLVQQPQGNLKVALWRNRIFAPALPGCDN